MNMIFVLYLSIEHFILCLHSDISVKAAFLRRSESVSHYQGWNNFSRVTQAGILIMHHGDTRPKLVSFAFGCWHLAGFHIPVESLNRGYLGPWLFLAYWEAKAEKPFEPSYISRWNQFFFSAFFLGGIELTEDTICDLICHCTEFESCPWSCQTRWPFLSIWKYGGSSNMAVLTTTITVDHCPLVTAVSLWLLPFGSQFVR